MSKVGKSEVSAELGLLVACCRLNFAGRHDASLPDISDVDWDRFEQLAAFHRVEGLAWRALAPIAHMVPERVSYRFSASAVAIVDRNLRSAVASREILTNFQTENIPVLFLKGLTLGALVYRSPFAKSAIDTDLLIDPLDIVAAVNVLGAAGYRPIAHYRMPLPEWHKISKESVWLNDTEGLQLDLHTRTADNPRLIPDVDVHAPMQWITITDSLELPTLASDELVAYLAVHGASSAWFRLKWIADFAGLLHGRGESEIERLYLRSQELGAGRAGGQAFLLADRLFGTLGSSARLRSKLEDNESVRVLVRIALGFLTRDPAEPTSHLFGTLPIHCAQLLLLPGLTYKWTELSCQGRRILQHRRC